MGSRRNINVSSLGLCEHCGTLLTLKDMPRDIEWRCPNCYGALTNISFGYEKIDGKWEKTRWVGKDKQWTTEKPIGKFKLGNWFIHENTLTPF